ncbi:MAG TPA: hypothetical protein DEE98_06615 [Elusimicrobia bacterium]|nr:MAG: hypothetical protein A2278_06725 [Elusimicrobia bacterium RIFOXYA12_FULL_49_49]OGS11515.1 MAG: hypothetical protein A2386_04085 [Elusimicrobia bacterium RIFOXYB1_FULL_48_9]OGS16262.1 MAG: hypothetical protein A2251_01460 [Elusimicrobia bacterium RIFOXYA2_FULL_47_53]OGS26195.1 MAG: hypothetical protein A2339_02635 [Elusimicrobia bacterium RIFOXYB12_FULL_50_12]OGS31417.1 MAG: hypothetical protein A2323_09750 [Elusimicrobia bacterium RIFOXYB2_FULL_46_23]HBU70043.1 hypothetical protein [El
MANSQWIEVSPKEIRKWVSELMDAGKFKLLSTMTGYQDGDKLNVLYHFFTTDGAVNVRVATPLSEAKIPSITPILVGAVLYEREIQDLLGIKFDDIVDGRRMILPEQWPEGVYPLRKDYHVSKEAHK